MQRVNMPDGTVVNFPDGMSADDISSAMQSIAIQQPAQPQGMGDNGATWGAGSNFASGVLQGMGDEVKAVGAAVKESAPRWMGGNDGLPFGNAYDQAKTMYQGAREQYAKENPKTAFATDMAGQIAPWLVAAPLMPELKATTMLGKVGQGAKIGSATGTVSGFLNAEGGLGDRAKGGLAGALIGGAVGGAAPPIIDAATKGASWLANQTIDRLPFRQGNAASRKVAEAFMRDGLTPDEAMQRVAQMGPNAALMDVGPNSQGLARSAYTVPGEGKTAIKDFLVTRQEGARDANNVLQGGQIGRVTDMLDNLVPEQYRGTMDDLAKARSVDAGPLYKEAFSPVSDKAGKVFAQWDDRLQQFLDDPLIKQGMAKGIRTQQLEALAAGRPFNFQEYAVKGFDDGGNLIIGGTPNLRAMDAAKRGMDDIINEARDPVSKQIKWNDYLRAVDQVRGALVNKLDDITTVAGRSPYAEARQAWAGPSSMMDALNLGKKILGGTYKNADEMANTIKNLTPDQLHYLRIGAVQDLRDRVGNLVTRADATKKLMDIPALEEKIRLAFGDPETFRQYISGLQNEKQMFDTYGRIIGGSRTGEVLPEQASAATDPNRIVQGIKQIFTPSSPVDPLRGIGNVIGGAKDRAVMTQPMSRNLAQLLTGRDATPLNDAFQAAQMGEARRRSLARLLSQGGGISAGAAQGQ